MRRLGRSDVGDTVIEISVNKRVASGEQRCLIEYTNLYPSERVRTVEEVERRKQRQGIGADTGVVGPRVEPTDGREAGTDEERPIR